MDYENNYQDYYMWTEYGKSFKARRNKKANMDADLVKEEWAIYDDLYYSNKDKGWKLKQYRSGVDLTQPRVDITEKNNPFTDISQDTLLVAKQFMVFAHIRCPKPPVRYAKGLLQSTIRMENTSYLGMGSVNVYCGSKEAFYMPFTNEEWHSAKAYPMKNSKKIIEGFEKGIKSSYEASKRMGDTRTYEEYKRDAKKYYEETMGTKNVGVRVNPNLHWWDKAIQDTVNLCQERGVMMNG